MENRKHKSLVREIEGLKKYNLKAVESLEGARRELRKCSAFLNDAKIVKEIELELEKRRTALLVIDEILNRNKIIIEENFN